MHKLASFLLVTLFGAGLSAPALADIEIIAHRGALRLAPENTLAAQRLAYELGADTVECDIRLSKDNVPVIMHDHDLDRTTNTSGLIASRTLEEIKRLDAGSWFGAPWAGERVPTLAEMLEVAKSYNRCLLLDIKGQYMAPQVVQVIKTSGIPLRQISFLTWWTEMTADYARLLPGAKILRGPTRRPSGASIMPDQLTAADLEAMRTEGVTVLCFSLGSVSRQDIRRFHAAGFEASLIYPNRMDSFAYEDAGLHSFWTDFVDITVASHRRKSQQWVNWAEASGLSPDQSHTWQDVDGDGATNLTEFALGTNPLGPAQRPVPSPGYQNPGTSTRSPSATSIDWTVDLREDWSQLLTVTPQVSAGSGLWYNMSGNCCTVLTPSQLLFKFPVGTSGRQFYRLRFDVMQ